MTDPIADMLARMHNAAMVRHPLQAIRMRIPYRWSRRTVILLVMQTVDAAMHLRPRRKLLGRGVRLQTEQDPDRPKPGWDRQLR